MLLILAVPKKKLILEKTLVVYKLNQIQNILLVELTVIHQLIHKSLLNYFTFKTLHMLEKLNTVNWLNKRIPSLNPLLNLRGTFLKYLILPVPVVFLLIAFSLQLSKITQHKFQTQIQKQNKIKFWHKTLKLNTKNEFWQNKPILKKWKELTFPYTCSWISTCWAATLLEMETTTATPNTECMGLVPSLTETTCSLTLQKSLIQFK